MRPVRTIGLCRPLLHRLSTRAVDVHVLIHARDPANWHKVMLAGFVFSKFDGRRALRMIYYGELAALGANDGHIGLDGFDVEHVAAQSTKRAAIWNHEYKASNRFISQILRRFDVTLMLPAAKRTQSNCH